jgi:hypothetical protein
VLFAFIVFIEHPIRVERTRPPDHHVLPGFDPGAITNIEIQPWDRPAIAVQRAAETTNQWRLTHPISYPAQSELVEGLLEQLAALEWQESISQGELNDRPDAADAFGLAKPRYSLLLQGVGGTRHLDIGEQTAEGDQNFLYVVGSTSIYVANSNLLNWIPTDETQWRNRALLDLAATPFDAIRVRSAAGEFYLERDPTNQLWFISKPLRARADSAKINGLLQDLQQLRVIDFVLDDASADSDGLELQAGKVPDLTLAFLVGSNAVAGLEVGASVTNYPELAFARRASPSNIVIVAREPLRPWQAAYTNFMDRHLISLPTSLITSIEVQGADQFVVQKQTNGEWQVLAGRQFPADALLMEFWLESLTNLETEIQKTVVADFAPYGLSHPALHYALHFPPSAGNQAAPQIDFGTNLSGQVFERRLDEGFVDEGFVVNTMDRQAFEYLPRASWQLRDRRVWTFDTSNVVGVTVHQLGGTRGYLRDPTGAWTFAPGYHAPPFFNSDSLEEAVRRLGQLTAIYWDGVGDDPLDPFGFARTDHSVEIQLNRGGRLETLRIQFGILSPYEHPYATVVQDGRPVIFEFPGDLYEFVEHDLTVPSALRNHN